MDFPVLLGRRVSAGDARGQSEGAGYLAGGLVFVVRVILIILMMLAGCAETSYRSSNPSIPDAAHLLREAGKAYAKGDCKNAIELFTSLLEIAPQDVDTMLKIARCSYLLGNPESALAQYRAVLRIDPESRSAHYNILFIQIESLVETSSAVIENVPPRMDDEEALLAVAKGIIGSVKVNLVQPPKDGSSGP